MTDWLLVLSGLAIYIGAVIGIFGELVAPEIRDGERSKEEFRREYQDKVSVLQGKAEFELIETISKAEKLKDVFGRPQAQASGSSTISADERSRIAREISAITDRMKDVTEPRRIFTSVLTDYDLKCSRLRTCTGRLFLVSLLIPVEALIWAESPTEASPAGIVLLFIAVIAMLGILPYWVEYFEARGRLNTNTNQLADSVTHRIYLPPLPVDETPPAAPPTPLPAPASSGPPPSPPTSS